MHPDRDLTLPPVAEQAFADTDIGRALLSLHNGGSASQRRLAEYLLRNPVRIVASSIEDLAARTAVSTATISRFSRQAGFAGYPDLRGAVAATLQQILQPVDKLRDSFERDAPAPSVVEQGIEGSIANIRAAAQTLLEADLPGLVARLNAARTVYVVGFGISAHLAAMLTLALQPFCPQMVNVVEFGGTEVAAGRLMDVRPGDAVIVLSFPRYARDAVALAGYAKHRGAYVVGLTDSAVSPLAQISDLLLLAPGGHPILSSSYAGGIVVVEALATAMMLSNRDNVESARALTEAISAYLHRGGG